MDKNNDIKVYKISKWKEAPDSIKDLYSTINATFAVLSLIIDPKVAYNKNYALNELFARVLDDYNELEAKHQKDTGMISEYEEENEKLKSELDIKTDECDALISRVFKQDEEYTKLNEELYEVKKEREDLVKKCAELEKENTFNKKMQTEYCDIIEARLNQQYHKSAWQKVRQSKCESKDDALQKMIKEVAELEKEKIDLEENLKGSEESSLVEIIRLKDRCTELAINRLEKENNNLKQTLLNILETLEMKVGLRRVHLLDSYEDRANLIAVEHDRLLIKYEKLKVENNNLTTDTKRLSNAVEAWFNMFNDMRHKRDFIKKEYEKLKETNESLRRAVRFLDEGGSYDLHSCPVACECENFKPKVHHSYDPLDDLPDVEHS